MKIAWKEIAKAASGLAAGETLGHWWVGLFGGNLLPLDMGWFTFTRELNLICMVAWPVVFAALVIYAWGHRKPHDVPSSFGRSVPAG